MDEVDAIKNSMRDILRLVSSRDSISPEIRQLLAQAVTHAQNRITEIRQREERATQPTVPPQVSQRQRLLWELSGGDPQVYKSYLEQYPDQGLNQLATNPALLNNSIQNLDERFPQQRDQTQDGVQQAPLQSSNVWGFNYNPKNGKMLVKFQGGSLYQYDNVPPAIFKLFSVGAATAKTTGFNRFGRWWKGKSPSIGAAMHQLVKEGGYPYRRLR